MSEYQKHMKWVKSLKVGDVVCDCRYYHSTIKEIHPVRYGWMPGLVWSLINADWIHHDISYWIDVQWDKLTNRLKLTELHDYNLTFEDGYGCSAFNCCGPIDHDIAEHRNET
jgi:hypothetical protein